MMSEPIGRIDIAHSENGEGITEHNARIDRDVAKIAEYLGRKHPDWNLKPAWSDNEGDRAEAMCELLYRIRMTVGADEFEVLLTSSDPLDGPL